MMTDEIIELLNKYRNHSISQSEFEQLRTWVDESDENRRLMNTYIRYYKTEGRLNALLHTDTSAAIAKVNSRLHLKSRRTMMRRISAIAACLLVLIVGTTLVYNFVITSQQVAPYSRLQKAVMLTRADGSQIELKNGGVMVCEDSAS